MKGFKSIFLLCMFIALLVCDVEADAEKTSIMDAVSISASSKKLGNIFFDGEEKRFDISFESLLTEDVELNVKYTVLSDNSEEIKKSFGELSKTFTINKLTVFNDSVFIDFSKYGLYKLKIEVYDDAGLYYSEYNCSFSICRKSANINPEYDLGINPFFTTLSKENYYDGAEILYKAGFSHIRQSFNMGELNSNETEPEIYTNVLSRAKTLGITPLACFINRENNVYDFPDTDEERSSFANFVFREYTRHPDMYEYIEIWNEPQLEKFNNMYNKPEEYAKLIRAVCEKFDDEGIRNDVKICGISLCSVTDQRISWMRDVMETDTDGDGEADGYRWFDVVTVHHYANDWVSEVIPQLDKIDALLAEFGRDDVKLCHSEFGMSVYNSQTKENQEAEISQALLTLRAHRAEEQFYIYMMMDAWTNGDKESSFGILEYYRGETPYAAKPAFIAVSNMNKLLNGYSEAEVLSANYTNGLGATVYKFKNSAESSVVYSFYSNSDGTTYSFSPEEEREPVFCDTFGNVFEIEPESDGSYKLSLTQSPIYAAYRDDNDYELQPSQSDVIKNSNDIVIGFEKQSETVIMVNAEFPTAYAGDRVGVQVYDKENNEIVHIEQLELDGDKTCSFYFRGESYNDYQIQFGMKSLNYIYCATKSGEALLVIQDETESLIMNLSTLKVQEKANVYYKPSDSKNVDFQIFFASYRGSTLIDCQIFESTDMTKENNGYLKSFSGGNIPNTADKVAVFVFTSDGSLYPLASKYVVNS